MRVELRSPERTLALLSGDALLQFRDEGEVRLVLNVFSGDPGNMASLRHFLASELGMHNTGELTDDQVIDHLAPVVARSCVGLVRTEVLPVRAADAVTGDVVETVLEALFDSMVEQVSELEDIIPDAVLPPTFIQVAEMEASGMEFQNKLYKLTMDLLRFVGLEGELPSELAPEFTDSAKGTGAILNQLAEAFAGEINPLKVAGSVLAKVTQLGEALTSVCDGQGFNVVKNALKAGAAIMELLANPGDDPKPGEAGPAMKALASSQVAKIVQGAQIVAEVLDDGLKGKGQDPAPITIGPALLNGATTQGGKLIDGAVKQGEFLQGVMKGDGPEPPKPSKVADSFGESSTTQSGKLVDSAVDTALALTLLGGFSEADKKVLSEPRWWTKPEFPKGARLLGISPGGAWLVARADGSKKVLFDVYLQPESGPDVRLAQLSPEIKDGLARVFWTPDDAETLTNKPIFFEARTEDRRLRLQSPSAPIGEAKVVDEATFDKNTVSIDAVGFVLHPEGDPRVSGQDQITAGQVYLVALTTLPGLVELELHNPLAAPDQDGKAPKPLMTFNVMAEGKNGAKTGPGRVAVPWDPAKLPSAVRALRVAARPKRGAGDAGEVTVLVVPRFMFGDANIAVDDKVPEVFEPVPEAMVDAGYFALTADGPATPEVPAQGAWIVVKLDNAQQAKVKIFSREGDGGRQAVQALDLKLKDGRGTVLWKPAKPVDRAGMRIGFEVELNGQIVPGEEAPWVPPFLFGA